MGTKVIDMTPFYEKLLTIEERCIGRCVRVVKHDEGHYEVELATAFHKETGEAFKPILLAVYTGSHAMLKSEEFCTRVRRSLANIINLAAPELLEILGKKP